jgi:hypothetical protein
LQADKREEAAVVAWLLSLVLPDEAEQISVLVREEPSLAAQFGIEPVSSPAEVLGEIRRLAAVVAAAEALDAGTLETLSRLAGEAATHLRALDERDAAKRSALLERIEQSSLGFGAVTTAEGASTDKIEQALNKAEGCATELAGKEVALHEATGRRDYKAVASLADEAAQAQEAFEAAKAVLVALLVGVAPAEDPMPSGSTVSNESEPLSKPIPVDESGPTELEEAAEADTLLSDTATEISPLKIRGEPSFAAESAAQDFLLESHSEDLQGQVECFTDELAAAPVFVESEKPHVPPISVEKALLAGAGATDVSVSEVAATAATDDITQALVSEDGTWVTTPQSLAEAAFWTALSDGRPGLAKALLEAGALSADDQDALRHALHLTALNLVADGSGEVDDRVGEEAEALIQASSARTLAGDIAATVWQLALPSAALLTVLAPGGNADRLLDFLLEQPVYLPQMHALARTLSENGAARSGLGSSAMLASFVSEDERRRELDKHCVAVREWLDHNRDAQLNNYAPARILWSRMLAEDEPLGSMLAAVVRNDVRRASDVAAMLVGFSGRDEMRRLDVEIRGLKLMQKAPISFGAERDLSNLLDEVQPLLRKWTRLAAWTTSRKTGAGAAEVKRLREDLLNLLPKAQEELTSQPGLAAAPLATSLLQRFAVWLQTGSAPRTASSADQLLALDVISVPLVHLDPTWRMCVRSDAGTLAALTDAARGAVSIETAIERRIAARDFAGAVLALGLIDEANTRAELDREIRNSAGRALAETMGTLTQLRSDTEAAEAAGRLPFEQAQPFMHEIDMLEESLNQASPEDIPALVAAFELLDLNLRKALSDAEHQVRERITSRLRGLDLARAAAIRTSVEAALTQGWLAVAEDLVDRAEAGERVEEPVEASTVGAEFENFFPDRSQSLSAWLKGNKAGIGNFILRPDSLPDDIRASGIALPERSLPLAKAWAACGRPGERDFQRAVITVFSELGFVEPRTEGLPQLTSSSADARFTVRTVPLRDREITLLPDFGSVANGSYTVLCLWRQPEVNQIRTALQKTGGRADKVIVLFFGVLTNQDRRELTKMARNGQITSVLVLDQVLALHLALTEQNRLRTFFACTLPFSGVKPWSETGAPPPEMFFGRHNEQLSIEARTGQLSHLVYGGRQLGKTALLRQVEGSAAGDPNRVVRYVDIKRFGNTAPTEDLWTTLAEALRPSVPISLDPKGDAATRFRKEVRDWLNAHPEHSILLLLDEADKFFKEDQANRYRITEELRALSEDTRRRFKPVFAGLENVQRMARDPNNPIAQLATPLPIGPLLRGAERRAAEALVRWPFSALGFTLAPEAVNRILIFANYYPSLIQLVCQNLLHALRSKGGGAPPWRVEMSDVEQLLSAPEVRRAAFEKFRITLELDQRYFLLALVVAELSQKDPEALAVGIPVRDLHAYASMSWPAGFPPEFGETAFEALADQMVGLGLLRSLDRQCYALRSSNLIHLIGSPKSISQQLNAFLDRDALPEPDPLEDRRIIDGTPSLLSTRQEAEIVGAAPSDRIVVCLGLSLGGSDIGDTSRLEKAVREAAKSVQGRRDVRIETPILKARTLESFRAEAKALAAPRKEPGRRLILVTPSHGWTPEWVAVAQEAIVMRPPGGVPLRFVFLADAKLGWEWTQDHGRRDALLSMTSGGSRLVVEVVPGLWNRPSLDVWLELHDPTGMLPDWLINDREVLLRGTGGWDWALRRICAVGRQGFAKMDAVSLAEKLLAQGSNGIDPVSDLRTLPEAIRLLLAVEEAESLRAGDEKVDANLIAEAGGFTAPPPGLVWALAVEAVVPGSHGLQLNSLLRAALPLLKAGLQ